MRAVLLIASVVFVASCAPTGRIATVEFLPPDELAKRCFDAVRTHGCLGMWTGPNSVAVSEGNWDLAAELLCAGRLNPPRVTRAYLGCYEVVGHELRHVIEGRFHD